KFKSIKKMSYKNKTVCIDGKQYQQVNKTFARKLFAVGQEIYLHPCNMSLYSFWSNLMSIKLDELELESKIEWAHKCVENCWDLDYVPDVTPELQFDSIVAN